MRFKSRDSTGTIVPPNPSANHRPIKRDTWPAVAGPSTTPNPARSQLVQYCVYEVIHASHGIRVAVGRTNMNLHQGVDPQCDPSATTRENVNGNSAAVAVCVHDCPREFASTCGDDWNGQGKKHSALQRMERCGVCNLKMPTLHADRALPTRRDTVQRLRFELRRQHQGGKKHRVTSTVFFNHPIAILRW
jgi:hypothetical protein